MTASGAVLAAAQHLATPDPDVVTGDEPPRDQFGQALVEPPLDLSGFAPHQLSASPGSPDLSSVFTAAPLDGPITVSLIWFPLAGEVRLGWHLRVAAAGGPVYRFIVDAADARILLCRRLTSSIVGHASVVLRAGAERTAVDVPLDPATYGPPMPAGLPVGWPDSWLDDATTSGLCVRAINVAAGNSVVTGIRVADVVTFRPPADVKADDQLVVNLFAFCSIMHDALYLLGFREVDGNFQRNSLARGGRPGDAVLAKVHPGAVQGTANMGTPVDGLMPVMNIGLVASTGRHTALDPDVVHHEYTHGLTNRLVGGPMNDAALDAEQSGGMGEGWSDYVACTLLDKTVVGDWVVARPKGIRRNSHTDAFPGTYDQVGRPAYAEVHDLEELWCAVLMSLGRSLGRWPFLQIMVDALKLTSANPSLLAARDAILLAASQYRLATGDSAAAADAYVADAWRVFARYGMGPGARTNGATLTGIVADFNPPRQW